MRVAYIAADTGVPVFGCKGCSIHVQEMIRALLAMGCEVDLFAARLGGEPPSDLSAVRVHELEVIASRDPAERERAALQANRPLRLALEHRGPFDLVYERQSLWSHAGMEYALDAEIPSVLEVNSPLIEEQAEFRGLIDRVGALRVATRVFRTARVIVAVSDEVRRYVSQVAGIGHHVHTISNGVDPARFGPHVSASLPAPALFTVGFVGTLKPWHGLDALIEAFARLAVRRPEVRLLIVGDGPQRESLEREVKFRNLTSRVTLTGAVAPTQIPGLLASMDVATAPYDLAYEFYFSPLKLFEYMAAGRAVVASRVGQISRVIDDGRTGILCPPGDAPALADALARLADDAPLRNRLGESARAAVIARHSWQATAQRVLDLAGFTERGKSRPERAVAG